jgi:hypothetical protein
MQFIYKNIPQGNTHAKSHYAREDQYVCTHQCTIGHTMPPTKLMTPTALLDKRQKRQQSINTLGILTTRRSTLKNHLPKIISKKLQLGPVTHLD